MDTPVSKVFSALQFGIKDWKSTQIRPLCIIAGEKFLEKWKFQVS